MRVRTRRDSGSIIVAFLVVVLIAAGGMFLISLETNTDTIAPSGSTQIVPKQDCCVPATDLRGTWNFTNGNGSSFVATVSDKAIKIFMTNKGTSMVYWEGTFESYKPIGSEITSEVIYDDSAILSQSKSKNFIVGDTTLSFDFTAMGATKTVVLQRV